MKIATLASTALVLGLSGSAFAGGFVGLGIGSPSKLSDDRDGDYQPDGRTFRLFGGYSYPVATGRLSGELSYVGFDAKRSSNLFEGHVIALAAKYNHKISDGFEVFGRLGVQQTSASDDTGRYSMDGVGPVVGAGFEYHLPLKVTFDPAIYVDGNYTSTKLDRTNSLNGNVVTLDTSDLLFSLGVVVGF